MSEPFTILFEDNHCLAVCKPAGLLTQGVPTGLPSLEHWVKAYIKESRQKAGKVYLGIPHRLDRPVSGVVIFARNTKAAQRLAEQFQQRTVTKVYWAAVAGAVEPESGRWEDWLLKVPEEARAERVEAGTPSARHAILDFRKLHVRDGCTLLEIRPLTGRMHQIRVQASVRGWPILGDLQYGSNLPFGPNSDVPRDRLIALHARQLTFLHPIRYEPITLTAPLPDVWRASGLDPEGSA